MPAVLGEFPQITIDGYWNMAHEDFIYLKSFIETKSAKIAEEQAKAERGRRGR